MAKFDFVAIDEVYYRLTGAEIEQCVTSATKARLADAEITQQDLITVAVKMFAFSRTMKEDQSHSRLGV